VSARTIEQIAQDLWIAAMVALRIENLPTIKPITPQLAKDAMRIALAAAVEIKAAETAANVVAIVSRGMPA
jgi:hypothetical protein